MTSRALLRRRLTGALVVTTATCAWLAACEERFPAALGNVPSDEASVAPDGGDGGAEQDTDAAVVPRGARVLGLDVDLSGQTLLEHVQTARDAGATTTTVSYAWDEVEVPFDGGAPDAATTALFQPGLHVANLVLSSEHASALLEIDAVDVSGPRMPADLAGLPLDDPQVAVRYGRVIDYVVSQMPDLQLDVLLVASGVDRAFGDDANRYAQLATFIERAKAYAQSVGAPFRIGFAVGEDGMAARRSLLDAAWNGSDVLGVTVFPADASGHVLPPASVGDAFDRIAQAAPPDKPVVIRAGYPSAAACGSDGDAQAAFVRTAFQAWDRNATRIAVFDLVELDDASLSVAKARAERQGRSDEAWVAFFGSLGLRDGTAGKAALGDFRALAHARGW
ncbi:hypothetical protein AKJ09_08777 [Labilithrix luteola]|uniref:Uncharacterized protein n=1 Tax=Labilithrix luteola TaxID=1391654 RepID=A0A0K1Q8Q5_9BACT|nr:hypothetical protein [Labilithrix luteola]AKV02114.1 hypothetical protein AKJ09_08777 [Labilithrix luteola]